MFIFSSLPHMVLLMLRFACTISPIARLAYSSNGDHYVAREPSRTPCERIRSSATVEMCLFCSSRDRSKVGIVQDDPLVVLLRCEHCHAVSVSRMPKAEYLRTEYYSHYYDDCGSENVTFDFPKRLADHIVRHVCNQTAVTQKPNFNLLDFGGGDGSIAIAAARTLLAHG